MISKTPPPPYYAVIFSNTLVDDPIGYKEMADRMEVLAQKQPGFLGLEAARTELGITVSYWENLEAIQEWRQNLEHLEAQKKGIDHWYDQYALRIALVERESIFSRES